MTLSARELYAQVGIGAIPKLLGLLDRNRLSPTYGCFDKAFWHYRTASFPSGMFQEYVLPLALVYAYQFPGGEDYYQRASLKSWVRAGIQYASKSAHRDGSCDDYFPYERALGAVVFSLYACTESALLLGLRDSSYEPFFVTRGQWLLAHDEAGRLANHHALAVLALYNVYLLSGQTVFQQAAQARLERSTKGAILAIIPLASTFSPSITRRAVTRECSNPCPKRCGLRPILSIPTEVLGARMGAGTPVYSFHMALSFWGYIRWKPPGSLIATCRECAAADASFWRMTG
jgi:hypothetical protein